MLCLSTTWLEPTLRIISQSGSVMQQVPVTGIELLAPHVACRTGVPRGNRTRVLDLGYPRTCPRRGDTRCR